jgi:hypothetical protein
LGVQILLKINKVEFYFLLLDSQDIWSSLKQGFCLGQFSQVPTVDLENGRVIYGPVLLFSFINKNHMNYVKIIVYGKTYYNYTHGVLCNYYINKSWKEQSSRKINCLHKNKSLSVSTMVKIVPSYLLFCFFPPCPKTPIKVVSENTSFGSLLSVLSV